MTRFCWFQPITTIFFEKKKSKVFKILEHLPYLWFIIVYRHMAIIYFRVSVSRRTFGPGNVNVHAWFGATPQLTKCIWLMAVAQHQFYHERKHSRVCNTSFSHICWKALSFHTLKSCFFPYTLKSCYKVAPAQEILSLLHAKNKCADEPAHPCSLISTFVICYLESQVIKLASCKISMFQ